MLVPSWFARLLAGVSIVVLAVPIVLSSPWMKGFVFARAAAWLQTGYGLELRAAGFDYRLTALAVTLDRAIVLDPRTPDVPVFKADRIEVDLARSALGGALDFDRIHVANARIVLDASALSALRDRPASGSAQRVPPWRVGNLRVDDLDLVVDDGAGMRLAAQGTSAALQERQDGALAGQITVNSGLSVGNDLVLVAFDRAEAIFAVEKGARVVGSVTGSSAVGSIRAEGTVPLDGLATLAVRYDGTIDLASLGRWWNRAPPWSGQARLRGEAHGSLQSPEASFHLESDRFAWPRLAPANLDMAGSISRSGLHVTELALTSRQGTARGGGTIAFDEGATSRLEFRWSGVGANAIATLLDRSFASEAPTLLSGTARVAWSGPVPHLSSVQGRLEVNASGAGADRDANGQLVADGARARWQLDYRQTLAGGTHAAIEGQVDLDASAPLDSAANLSFTLQSDELRRALVQLQRLGLRVPDASASVDVERMSAEGTVQGPLRFPVLRGTVDAQGVRVGDARGLHVESSFVANRDAIEVSDLAAVSAPLSVRMNGRLPWSSGSGTGTFEAQVSGPAILTPGILERWSPTGALFVSGDWRGSARDPALKAQVSGRNIQFFGNAVQTILADVAFANRRVEVSRLQATQGDGTLRGAGVWDLDRRTVEAQLTGQRLSVRLYDWRDAGAQDPHTELNAVAVEADVSMSVNQRDGTVDLNVGNASVMGRRLGAISAHAEAIGGQLRIEGRLPQHAARIDARVTLDGEMPFTGRAVLEGSDLGELARAAANSEDGAAAVRGSFDATLDVSGQLTDLPGVDASLSLTDLRGSIQELPLALPQAGRLTRSRGRVSVADPIRVSAGTTTIDLAAPISSPGVAVKVDGTVPEALAFASSVVPDGTEAAGTFQLELLLADRLDAPAPTGHARVALASVTRAGRELARDTTVLTDIDPGEIRVTELQGIVLGGSFAAGGTVPTAWLRSGESLRSGADPPATFWMTSSADIGSALALLRGQPAEARGALNFSVEGTAAAPRLEAIRAALRDDTANITLGRFRLAAARPTRLRLDAGQLFVDDFEWRGPESDIVASGSLALTEATTSRLNLRGRGSLALLTLVVPAAFDGQTSFDLSLTGPPGARELAGTLAMDEGSVVVPEWRVSLAGWSGRIDLEPESINVSRLGGQINGGDATVQGRLARADGSAASSGLSIEVRSAFLDLPRGLRSQLDASARWSNVAGRSRISGNATITASAYREPITELARLAATLLDASSGPSSGAAGHLPQWLAATELDVELSSEGPLAVSNSIAQVELQPQLRLTGTIGRLALAGEVALADDGRLNVGGRQYRLRDSRVQFSPERGLVPRLDLTGDTRVGDYTVNLRLSGPANELETRLRSDPPLGERDLQSLLVTGQTTDSLSRRGSADQEAVGAVSSNVLGFAGQFLGFDTVRVGTTDDLSLISSDVDPALRLTVSKRLGNRFELILSDNLDESELTWVIIYRPRPGFELRATSRDNTEYTGEFRQEIAFGPGVSPPRPVARRRAPPERVASVTVSGDPGQPASEVLAMTTLRQGDRFDFGRWLDDRERLARSYQARGYLAARIVPTRRASGDPAERRVALDYRITRGPQTILNVSGYTPPDDLMARLRQAWSDNGLLELLEGDFASVMRGHLVAAGHLRATIAVEVDTSVPNQVTATIRVDPGPRTTDRHLAFDGNAAMSDDELLTAIRTSGLTISPWLDPAPLVSTLETAYAARGYLAARVNANPVVFSGAAATLPISIEDGRQATVATLTVTGADRVGAAAAGDASGLRVGGPFASGAERGARAALERHYHTLGYRDAAVESQAAVRAAEGRVDITFRVIEGPRYIVHGVRTKGVESTRPEVVARAARIEPGQPASQDLAETTRRQLYDIGTFRSAEVTFEPVEAAATGTSAANTIPVDAVVNLQESRRFLLLYGVEASNQYQSLFDQRVTSGGVAADLRDRNFLGRGWMLGAGLRYEPSYRSARLLMAVPRLGSSRIRTNLYLDTSSEERGRTEDVVFRDDETSVTLEQRWRPRGPLDLSWGYSLDARDLRFADADTGGTLTSFKGYLASLAGAVVIDRRDNLFDARRGWLASASAQWGLKPLGSDFNYLRTLVRASYYHPLGPLTLASNVRWGNLHPFGGDPPLNVLDLFYTAGGTQTVRGFKQDSLSAYELLDAPIGGTKLLVLNEEVRVRLFWLFSGAGFVDLGNTFTNQRGIVLSDLAVGAGLGLRIRTPLAPVRIDVGFPVRSNTGQTGWRWHFSIGQIF